jgi:hypothetical protein
MTARSSRQLSRASRQHGVPSPAWRGRPAAWAALLVALLLGATSVTTGCADKKAILFENHFDRAMTVHVDGDRLLILRPGVTEGIPYSTAAWAWPRTIEARDYATGELYLRLVADTTDLIQYRWHIDIR